MVPGLLTQGWFLQQLFYKRYVWLFILRFFYILWIRLASHWLLFSVFFFCFKSLRQWKEPFQYWRVNNWLHDKKPWTSSPEVDALERLCLQAMNPSLASSTPHILNASHSQPHGLSPPNQQPLSGMDDEIWRFDFYSITDHVPSPFCGFFGLYSIRAEGFALVPGAGHGQHDDQLVAPALPQVTQAHNQPVPAHDGDAQTSQEVAALPMQFL